MRSGVEGIVKRVFPKARAGEMGGMRGWIVKRPTGAPRFEREGTMPSDKLVVAVAERKAGPTLYVWYPAPGGIAARRAELEKAGFKVMVGCLVFARKRPYPFDAVEALLRDIKKSDGS